MGEEALFDQFFQEQLVKERRDNNNLIIVLVTMMFGFLIFVTVEINREEFKLESLNIALGVLFLDCCLIALKACDSMWLEKPSTKSFVKKLCFNERLRNSTWGKDWAIFLAEKRGTDQARVAESV